MNIPTAENGLPARLLERMTPITLDEMRNVRLMENRTDCKFVTSAGLLPQLLEAAAPRFSVQVNGGKRVAPYLTQYFDTPALSMYTMHQNGKLNRQKIRIRSYVDSGVSFLEIKNRNNRGRTSKIRVPVRPAAVRSVAELDGGQLRFLNENAVFDAATLEPSLSSRFERITLVSGEAAERVTIDLNLSFLNHRTGSETLPDDLMIVELKQAGRQPSGFSDALRRLRIRPHSFSKYCMGSVLTNPALKYNRFKSKWIFINKIIHRTDDTIRL
jgi:hypothetical protein